MAADLLRYLTDDQIKVGLHLKSGLWPIEASVAQAWIAYAREITMHARAGQ